MKHIKIKLSALAVLTIVAIGVTFTSCQKDVQIIEPTTTNQPQNLQAMSWDNIDPLNLESIRQLSFDEHNSYMVAALVAYNNGELETENTLTNMNSQLSWSENYFTTNSSLYNSTVWDEIENEAVENFGQSELIINQRINALYNSTASSYKNYLLNLTDAIKEILNGNESINFLDVCSTTFNDMQIDNNLSNDEKTALASIIGVAEGSYQFWNANYDNWPQTNTPQLTDLNFKMSTRTKKIISFVAADAMGALDGAAAGSVLPGVGTAAGGVLGGALYSGLTAWFW